MEKIYEILAKADQIAGKLLEPIINKLIQFFSSGEYTAIAAIGLFLALIILVGLITWIRKAPKLFFFLLLVFSAVVAASLLIKGS